MLERDSKTVQRPGPVRLTWTAWVAGGAMAAGIGLGLALAPSFHAAPIASDNGSFFARGALSRALSTQLASERGRDGGMTTRIEVTFRDRRGALCRTFASAQEADAFAGIACREGDGWRIALLAPLHANGAMPEILRDSVAAQIVGTPLDSAQERAARDRGWL